jgi:hypothetical protein
MADEICPSKDGGLNLANGKSKHSSVDSPLEKWLAAPFLTRSQSTLAGIELMHMIRKGQLEGDEFDGLTAAEQFYALTR